MSVAVRAALHVVAVAVDDDGGDDVAEDALGALGLAEARRAGLVHAVTRGRRRHLAHEHGRVVPTDVEHLMKWH